MHYFNYFKMNLNFVYNLLASLTFSITFDVDSNEKQDYFVLHGDNSTAYLFRYDNVLKLSITTNFGFRHYETTEISTQFTFTWDGFKINDKSMQIIRSNGNISDLEFNGYTFLSPSKDFNQLLECNQEQPLHFLCSKTNYSLLALIFFSIGVLLRSDSIASKFWKVATKSCIQSVTEALSQDEDPYVTMV